jgi:hypothetical protein
MRKPFLRKILFIPCIVFIFLSCKKDAGVTQQEQDISDATLQKIASLGFSKQSVALHEDGYLVEGDIIITEQDLQQIPSSQLLRVGDEEQYRTFNLVRNLPRTITVSISSKLASSYVLALDEALARYNALNLQVKFSRVSSGGAIAIVEGHGSYLASAGFPTSSGDPYGQVKINARAIGNQPRATVATIIAHEIGHCIGFRHTDYMNRSYSCGGSAVNEGASSVGAIHIPGTPTGPDPNSWMLSCIGSGQNRPFNSNDRAALNYLY